ncbi:hypothetical protein CLV92_102322 [Kineococcus xinjiangensis]|uniref:GyrI-like small molecule binding domain-containing protein n=1 Tax=Kineococcus xinjiangensis TaxID=512762 RepID=A0A2S6IVF4_9ACTN|nr:GyrI-like domain-containing protein [Kineococcus xinjiangensis]PPK98169.1 hypothetical protein CLV92_102322 [Kineococcus xinjiangensis]
MTAGTLEKYDVKRVHRHLYRAPREEFVLVDVPPSTVLAVDGRGDPNTSPEYVEAVEALFSVAYALKFLSRRERERDFTVAPLEGLWRAADTASFIRRDKDGWEWTMLIAQPGWITAEEVERARAAAGRRKRLPALELLGLRTLDEGLSAQILHVGPYDDEGPVLARLHREFMPARGLTFGGDHHEIYLRDARRTPPGKLRTILRQPVRPA